MKPSEAPGPPRRKILQIAEDARVRNVRRLREVTHYIADVRNFIGDRNFAAFATAEWRARIELAQRAGGVR